MVGRKIQQTKVGRNTQQTKVGRNIQKSKMVGHSTHQGTWDLFQYMWKRDLSVGVPKVKQASREMQ